ncbi:MAG TPA: amino acid racemase [Spirochaetota bacterium]|nr:amino acid racemase [Spirochaetota bacterium]HPS87989.1 amino acid racemase [Spirochaetota bacterium]
MKKIRTIGIVGGVGPYAGIVLNRMIFDESRARCDRDFPEVHLISASGRIGDRTEFILSPRKKKNPAYAIVDIVENLAALGSDIIAIPCNTAHSPVIFDVVQREIKNRGIKVQLINMIDEVIKNLQDLKKKSHKKNLRTGLLATVGTNTSGVYRAAIEKNDGMEFVSLPEEYINLVHETIYNPQYGLKATGVFVSDRAVKNITAAVENLVLKGTDCVIFGCTELSMVLPRISSRVEMIDSLRVLALTLLKRIKMM